jgi:hypothetical protein
MPSYRATTMSTMPSYRATILKIETEDLAKKRCRKTESRNTMFSAGNPYCRPVLARAITVHGGGRGRGGGEGGGGCAVACVSARHYSANAWDASIVDWVGARHNRAKNELKRNASTWLKPATTSHTVHRHVHTHAGDSSAHTPPTIPPRKKAETADAANAQ